MRSPPVCLVLLVGFKASSELGGFDRSTTAESDSPKSWI
jgi:hypothetical protein